MILPSMCTRPSQPVGSIRMIGLLLLCLCVIINMLGLPVTLLNPGEIPDQSAASFYEGFSVPPSPIELGLPQDTFPAMEGDPCVGCLVLASTPFHPPILARLLL